MIRSKNIYVIYHPDGIRKIGHSQNPRQRFDSFQKTSSAPLTGEIWFEMHEPTPVKAVELERATHARLQAKRLVGEWFRISKEEVRQAIAEAADSLGVAITERDFPFNDYIRTNATSRPVSELDLRLVRAGRALSGRTYFEIEEMMGVPRGTLHPIMQTNVKPHTIDVMLLSQVRSALEQCGVVFSNDGVSLSSTLGCRRDDALLQA